MKKKQVKPTSHKPSRKKTNNTYRHVTTPAMPDNCKITATLDAKTVEVIANLNDILTQVHKLNFSRNAVFRRSLRFYARHLMKVTNAAKRAAQRKDIKSLVRLNDLLQREKDFLIKAAGRDPMEFV